MFDNNVKNTQSDTQTDSNKNINEFSPTLSSMLSYNKDLKISNDLLFPYLIYNSPIPYSENIVLYPVTMKDYLKFQQFQIALIIRKDSTFTEKEVIKMTYYDFLKFTFHNIEFAKKYDMLFLINCYGYMWELLHLVCKSAEISIKESNGHFVINGEEVTDKIFNDIRRIIILQNDINFDIDEFIHYDTEQALLNAEQKNNKLRNDESTIEDYIDSLIVALHISESDVMKMSIRKFWRYIKRINSHEDYTSMRNGECSGMVKFKEPLKHWMTSIHEKDKYEDVKMSESELSKIAG